MEPGEGVAELATDLETIAQMESVPKGYDTLLGHSPFWFVAFSGTTSADFQRMIAFRTPFNLAIDARELFNSTAVIKPGSKASPLLDQIFSSLCDHLPKPRYYDA